MSDDIKFNLSCRIYKNYISLSVICKFIIFFSGILNSNNKFAAAAAAPIILNIILIVSILVSYFQNYNIAKQLSYGVTIAGISQLIFLIYFHLKFYKPSIKLNFKITNQSKIFFKNYYRVFFHLV